VTEPLRLVFGVHLHQPVGNLDHVFQDHVRDVYRPLVTRMAEADFLPITLHISGPLLEWLEAHEGEYLDLVGRLAAEGKVELLLSGLTEPVLAMLPRADRLEQIGWMREALRRRFGVEASGLWLTERVWEPDLAGDLARAGVQYVLVDDRHFLVAGFRRDQLHGPFRTEHDGQTLALFPIDEQLRYLVPFKPPAETAGYLRRLRVAGHRMAVLADDGEKFGGWPGTREWVYEKGWLAEFVQVMRALREAGEVALVTPAAALREVPSAGLAYLPSASYREMEQWALPAEASLRLARLEAELGAERVNDADGALVRGTHWRHFLVKYPEANRMHKKMVALSELCRARGEPAPARRAIALAQCNDAYWHGVFGGLYLPHLRQAVWRNLAQAEGALRAGEGLAWEALDLDGDGHVELWLHSAACSVLVSPWRGGAVEEFTRFGEGVNYADVLTRRREAYHTTPSPTDLDDRAILQERVLAGDVTRESLAAGDYQPLRSWARVSLAHQVRQEHGHVDVLLEGEGLTKRLRFTPEGVLEAHYTWDASAQVEGAQFTTELSLSRPLELRASPEAVVWAYPIATVAKSERGLDETVQGTAYLVRWPAALGRATLTLG
jgi:hypothetical protein